MNTKVKGVLGEVLAKRYLEKQGYKILFTNYTNKIGEIDIVAKLKEVIVFIEVKYRETAGRMLPREAVDEYKQHKIRQTALLFMKEKRCLDANVRFDVIDIVGEQVTHIDNAF